MSRIFYHITVRYQLIISLYCDDYGTRIVQIFIYSFVEKPDPPSMASSVEDFQACSPTVRWKAPADDGGSLITGYLMILKGDTERDSVNITDPGTTSHTFGSLERDTNYAVKTFARNAVFEYIKLIYTFFSERYGDKIY